MRCVASCDWLLTLSIVLSELISTVACGWLFSTFMSQPKHHFLSKSHPRPPCSKWPPVTHSQLLHPIHLPHGTYYHLRSSHVFSICAFWSALPLERKLFEDRDHVCHVHCYVHLDVCHGMAPRPGPGTQKHQRAGHTCLSSLPRPALHTCSFNF